MKTLIATLIVAAGILAPSAALGMQYDRISKSLPGQCMNKDFAKKAAKFCYIHGPAVGRR